MFDCSLAQLATRSALTTTLILALVSVSGAQVRSSASYQIMSDSINVGGGLATSTSYQQESTVGEVATGESASASFELRAGYQQMQEVTISITAAPDVVMDPSLPGLTGGTSQGSTSVRVTTDSPAGYSLSIAAAEAPAMRSGADTIADYAPGAAPDFSFVVGVGEAAFGFSPEGPDLVQRYRDDGASSCDVLGGADTALACWDGLSTTGVTIATGAAANQPTGASTTVQFRVGLGGNNAVAPGDYYATTTLTALPL